MKIITEMRNDKIPKPKSLTTYQNADASTYLRLQRNQEIRENLQNISQLLNTGLSAETLDICIKLCEAGVHPQSLADAVNAFRSEMSRLDEGEH